MIWNGLILAALIVFDYGLTVPPKLQLIAIDDSSLTSLLQFIKNKLAFLITGILVLVYGSGSTSPKTTGSST